jgi:hypothetical protein
MRFDLQRALVAALMLTCRTASLIFDSSWCLTEPDYRFSTIALRAGEVCHVSVRIVPMAA